MSLYKNNIGDIVIDGNVDVTGNINISQNILIKGQKIPLYTTIPTLIWPNAIGSGCGFYFGNCTTNNNGNSTGDEITGPIANATITSGVYICNILLSFYLPSNINDYNTYKISITFNNESEEDIYDYNYTYNYNFINQLNYEVAQEQTNVFSAPSPITFICNILYNNTTINYSINAIEQQQMPFICADGNNDYNLSSTLTLTRIA